jgi:hypothetical protein
MIAEFVFFFGLGAIFGSSLTVVVVVLALRDSIEDDPWSTQ